MNDSTWQSAEEIHFSVNNCPDDPSIYLEVVNKLDSVKMLRTKKIEVAEAMAKYLYSENLRIKNQQQTSFDPRALDKMVLAIAVNLTDGPSRIDLTPDMLITSDFLSKKILPWVELVRTELFASSDNPCQDLKEMKQWIQRELQQQPVLSKSIDTDEYLKAFRHLLFLHFSIV